MTTLLEYMTALLEYIDLTLAKPNPLTKGVS